MNANRFRPCFQYKLRGLIKPSLIFLGVFIIARFILPLALYFLATDTVNIQFVVGGFSGSDAMGLLSVTYLFSTAIFLFVGGFASFREEFNHLLAMNNTRAVQFRAAQMVQLTAFAILVVAGALVGLLENILAQWTGGTNYLSEVPGIMTTQPGAFIGSYLLGLLFFLAVFITVYAFGEAAAIISYRVGRAFIVPFWICFGLAFVVVPILVTGSQTLANILYWYIGGESATPVWAVTWHLMATSVIFKSVSWLTMRRIPQRA